MNAVSLGDVAVFHVEIQHLAFLEGAVVLQFKNIIIVFNPCLCLFSTIIHNLIDE